MVEHLSVDSPNAAAKVGCVVGGMLAGADSNVLAEDDWIELLTAEDRRSLTPLFWQHVLLYGEVKLDMTRPAQHPNDPVERTAGHPHREPEEGSAIGLRVGPLELSISGRRA